MPINYNLEETPTIELIKQNLLKEVLSNAISVDDTLKIVDQHTRTENLILHDKCTLILDYGGQDYIAVAAEKISIPDPNSKITVKLKGVNSRSLKGNTGRIGASGRDGRRDGEDGENAGDGGTGHKGGTFDRPDLYFFCNELIIDNGTISDHKISIVCNGVNGGAGGKGGPGGRGGTGKRGRRGADAVLTCRRGAGNGGDGGDGGKGGRGGKGGDGGDASDIIFVGPTNFSDEFKKVNIQQNRGEKGLGGEGGKQGNGGQAGGGGLGTTFCDRGSSGNDGSSRRGNRGAGPRGDRHGNIGVVHVFNQINIDDLF